MCKIQVLLDCKNTTRNALKTRYVSIYAVWLTPLLCDIIYNNHKFQQNSNHTVYIKEQKWNDEYIHYWWIKKKSTSFTVIVKSWNLTYNHNVKTTTTL
jgi:hypothetical protein